MQGLFVFVSEISFLIPPSAYPARCGTLLTTMLVRFDKKLVFISTYQQYILLKVLVNMFNSVLSTTPSDTSGLTALALWILICIIFVFIALFFYILILVKMKRQNRKTDPEPMHDEDEEKQKKPCCGYRGIPDDFDPLAIFVHILFKCSIM